MGIDCNGTCSSTCFGCSTMCAYSAEHHSHISCSSRGEAAGVSGKASDVGDEKIKSIPTECSSCGGQTEVKQMGFLYIKECPYCGRKEVVSI